jgi:transposase
MRAADDGTRHRTNHLECDGRRDRQWRRVLKGPRLRRLARTGAQADLDRRPQILGKISKQGNRYLRVLFVQAAWVVLVKPKSWQHYGLKPWIEAAKRRLHHNVLAIALANRLARIAWAVLNKERNFESVKTREMASRSA